SSRRRHTRCLSDWSSDVCSSDLKRIVREPVPIIKEEPLKVELQHFIKCVKAHSTPDVSGESAKRALDLALEITRQIKSETAKGRSEERRVGREGRCGRSRKQEEK